MSFSALAIVRIKRMIKRLRDPFRLSKGEQHDLDNMLTFSEQVEFERRWADQYHINGLMSLQLDDWLTPDELWWCNPITEVREAVVLAYEAIPAVEKYTDERWQTVELAKSMNYRDKSILAGAIRKAEFGDQHRQSYVDRIYRAFDGLDPSVALYFEHRGPRTWENLPKNVESWENVLWPNHPNSKRQAYIEVLQLKLKAHGVEDWFSY